MRKYFYQPDRTAKPNKIVQVRKIEYLPEPHSEVHQNHEINSARKANATVYKRTETAVLGHGKYIGEGKTITAFVWEDEQV